MREIEILVEMHDSADVVEEKVRAVAEFVREGITKDIYYYDPLRKEQFFLKRGQFLQSFRVRAQGGKTYLTHKRDIFNSDDTWSYSEELEIEVMDGEKMQQILEVLGFKKLIDLQINKKTFRADNLLIDIEQVSGIGLFLEVEATDVPDDERVEDVKQRIRKFIDTLGIQVSQELQIGKAEHALIKKHGSAWFDVM